MIHEFRRDPTSDAAIVFIHGFSGDATGTWTGIPDLLRQDLRLNRWDIFGFGYETGKTFDLTGIWRADPRLDEVALSLSTAFSLQLKQYKTVALVAHSMGGLVAQNALVKFDDVRNRTGHLLLFGTPSNGLVKASLASFWKRQVENMRAGGPFITNLRSEWKRLGLDQASALKFLAVAGELDQFVPPESSIEPFPPEVRRVIPGDHVSMIRADRADHPSVALIAETLTEGSAATGPADAARVAVEMREFAKVVNATLPHAADLDRRAAVSLALALDSMGRREEAMQVLQPHIADDSDAMGTLAGRHKRRWLVSRLRADAEKAFELYQRGYALATAKNPPDHHQAYYHGINLAFLELAYGGDYDAAAGVAAKVLAHCEQARPIPKEEYWRLTTIGDAHFILGEFRKGLEAHASAIQLNPEPWQVRSAQEQALRIADLCGHKDEDIQRLVDVHNGVPLANAAAE